MKPKARSFIVAAPVLAAPLSTFLLSSLKRNPENPLAPAIVHVLGPLAHPGMLLIYSPAMLGAALLGGVSCLTLG